jgi:PAS domain S-box-containing protein
MKDWGKTKDQLIDEIVQLRQRNIDLELVKQKLIKCQGNVEGLIEEHTIELNEANQQLQDELARRKTIEDELSGNRTQVRNLLANCPAVVYSFRPLDDTRVDVTFVSENIEEQFGYTPEEVNGLNFWQSCIHPDDLPNLLSGLADTLREGKGVREYRAKRRDGTYIWLRDANRVLFSDDGQPLEVVGSWLDITERKQLEEEKLRLEHEAYLTNRLVAIGYLASGVAHEINNPLTGVIGYADLLLQKDTPEDIKQDIEIIHEGAQHVADIVRKLLAFSRKQKLERTNANINHIIENVLSLIAISLKDNNIEISTELDPDIPLVIVDAGQLQQVFLNIIINAETEMKAAHNKGKLLITTERQNGMIIISFKDDGPGIAKENLNRIFDPFFTTREVGQGTGLGLSICYGIVAEHNGRIYGKSRKGNGATFTIEIPMVSQEAQTGRSHWHDG